MLFVPLLVFGQRAAKKESIAASAGRLVPGVAWQAKSVISGDFTCQKKTEYAILGTSQTQTMVAVFIRGITKTPKLVKYDAQLQNPLTAVLTVGDLEIDPVDAIGVP